MIVGTLGATKQAELFEYGIHLENSDIRAHVSAFNKTVYVFRTIEGVKAIEANNPPLAYAGQDGVNGPTGLGWLVRHGWINDLRKIPVNWARWDEFEAGWNTSKKGRFAVDCVLALMKYGRFPLWINACEDDRENIQLHGTDILVFARKKIQVKCDYPAGRTGNLFLQKAERNPLKRT